MRAVLARSRRNSAGGWGAFGFTLVAILAVTGCGGEHEEPPSSFSLEQVSPRDGEVFLNQVVTLHFSEPVAPTSITRRSLVILDQDDEPAPGSYHVQGDRVQFVPDPVRAGDLSGGGFRPGGSYTIEVRGFPHLDGLRSVDGQPLRSTFRFSLRAVPHSSEAGELFIERDPSGVEPLRLIDSRRLSDDWVVPLRVGDSMIFECDEPLFPPSVRSADFRLRLWGATDGEEIPLEVRLAENHDAGARRPLGTARVVLRPLRELAPSTYELELPPLGGPPLNLAGRSVPRPRRVRVEVIARGEDLGQHTEQFLDTRHRSVIAVPGVDGSAAWDGSGVVSIRYPRAAGDGGAGHVDLGQLGRVRKADVQAVTLTLGPGAECEIEGEGLRVLRAQRHVRLSGRLSRTGEPPDEGLDWREGDDLTHWLSRAMEEDRPWTVVIAGGDLVVEGLLETSGPLLLVAGGSVRVTGEVLAQRDQTWLLGGGGGHGLDPTRSALPIEIDPPEINPLREELRVAVLSDPLPAVGNVRYWLSGRSWGAAGGGSWRVRFVPESLPPGSAGWLEAARADPALLPPGERVRLLIELGVRRARDAGDLWDPPLVDTVELRWEQDRSD